MSINIVNCHVVSMAEAEQTLLFPDVKLPKREKTRWEQVCEMQEVISREGTLLPQSVAAEVLDVCKQRVTQLVQTNRLRTWEFLGKTWVCQADLKKFVDGGRKNGRRLNTKNV